MDYLMADIFEYSFDYFPGHVSCNFTDAFGKIHYVNEKIPVISDENIWFYNKSTILPQKGYIAGEIINKENGIINFSTIRPWGIETDENINVFFVYDNQIISEIEYKLIKETKYIIDNNVTEILNDDKHFNLFKKINKILIDYKNEEGTQGKAYNVMYELYKLYDKQNTEEKIDFTADILDMIVGNIGNKEYLIWEEYFIK
jgi:hypothetical protein